MPPIWSPGQYLCRLNSSSTSQDDKAERGAGAMVCIVRQGLLTELNDHGHEPREASMYFGDARVVKGVSVVATNDKGC